MSGADTEVRASVFGGGEVAIVDGNTKPWTDDDGIMYIGVIPFLLKETGNL